MDHTKSIESIGVPIMTYLKKNVIGIDHIAMAVLGIANALHSACKTLGCVPVEKRDKQGRLSGMRSAVLRLGGLVIVLVEGATVQAVEQHPVAMVQQRQHAGAIGVEPGGGAHPFWQRRDRKSVV